MGPAQTPGARAWRCISLRLQVVGVVCHWCVVNGAARRGGSLQTTSIIIDPPKEINYQSLNKQPHLT